MTPGCTVTSWTRGTIADEQSGALLGDGPDQLDPEVSGSGEHVGPVATQKCRQVAPVPVGGDPPLSDGTGTQSGALLCEQNWRLHACVAGRPSGPLAAVPKNALQTGGPGTRGRCAVPLHVAEHTPMRKKIRMTGGDTQERQVGAHGANTQSSRLSGYTTPLLSCRGWFEPRGGIEMHRTTRTPLFFGREAERERKRGTEGRAQWERNREEQQERERARENKREWEGESRGETRRARDRG